MVCISSRGCGKCHCDDFFSNADCNCTPHHSRITDLLIQNPKAILGTSGKTQKPTFITQGFAKISHMVSSRAVANVITMTLALKCPHCKCSHSYNTDLLTPNPKAIQQAQKPTPSIPRVFENISHGACKAGKLESWRVIFVKEAKLSPFSPIPSHRKYQSPPPSFIAVRLSASIQARIKQARIQILPNEHTVIN